MLTFAFAVYAVWWYFTFGERFTYRKLFWLSWCVDLMVLWLALGAKHDGLPLGLHFLLPMFGLSTPVFVAQCLVSPFKD